MCPKMKNKPGTFPSLTPCVSTSQCLKAEDIASAVTYVLSAPPHVQVSPPYSLLLSCLSSAQFAFCIDLLCSCYQIGDVQMRPVEQVS